MGIICADHRKCNKWNILYLSGSFNKNFQMVITGHWICCGLFLVKQTTKIVLLVNKVPSDDDEWNQIVNNKYLILIFHISRVENTMPYILSFTLAIKEEG